MRVAFVILLASVAFFGALPALSGAGSTAHAAGPAIGMGEQKPNMFASRPWQRLGLRDARYLAPWDVIDDPYQLALLDTWMAAARQARVRVAISLQHSLRSRRLARTLPTATQFARKFRRLRARYPTVRDWLPWNEANSPGSMTEHRPRRAARYFDVVSRACRGCRVVAADVIDTPGMGSWVRRFKRAARTRPRIWGLHNYVDANQFTSRGTRTLLALTRGKIWFTEVGGVVLRREYTGRGRVRKTFRYGVRHAARATAHGLRLSCLSRRVARVYLYHWQAPVRVTSWDSGLLDAAGRTRPAYRVVSRWLKRGGGGSHPARARTC
jgi:polysaccharide biosynthesis protein PslG